MKKIYFFLKKNANKYINYLFILLIFLIPFDKVILFWIPPIIVLLWIIEGNFKEKWEILKRCKIFWALVIFLLTMLIATIINPPYNQVLGTKFHKNAFDYIFRFYFLYFSLVFIAITNLSKETIKKMIYAFIIAMLISEVISYLMFFNIIKKTHQFYSPFLWHSFYTDFVAFTVILLIDNFFKIKNKYLRIIDFIFILTATTNVFVNGGRIGQFTLAILFLFYLGYKFKKNLKIVLAGILIIPFIYIAAYKFSPVFKSRMNQTFNTLYLLKKNASSSSFYKTSFGNRVLMWKICLSDFKYNFSVKKLLFGNGFGKARMEYIKIRDKYFKKYKFIYHLNHPHDMYIYLLFNGGIILLGVYLYILFLFFKLNFFEYDIYAKIFGLTIFLLSFTEDTIIRGYSMLFFVTFTGMFYAYRRLKLFSNDYETNNTHQDSA